MIEVAFTVLLAAILTPRGWVFFAALATIAMTVPLLCEWLVLRRIA